MHASWGNTATESATFAATETAREICWSGMESARVIQNLENKFESIYLLGRKSGENVRRRESEQSDRDRLRY